MFTQAFLDSHSYNMWKWHTGKKPLPQMFLLLSRPAFSAFPPAARKAHQKMENNNK